MWSPQGQQVMIPTPRQPERHYGIGGGNYQTGECVVLLRRRKRRQEIAEFLQHLLDIIPTKRSMSRGIMSRLIKISKSMLWSEPRPVGSFSYICRPTVLGSIPLKCSGVTFAVKSRMVNSSPPSLPYSMPLEISLTVTI